MLSKKVRMERRCRRNSYKVVRKNKENQRLPRVVIHLSQQYCLLQLVDINGDTKVTISSNQKQFKELATKVENAKSYNVIGASVVGKLMGQYMKDNNISKYVFDRRSYKFHGRVESAQNAIQATIGETI